MLEQKNFSLNAAFLNKLNFNRIAGVNVPLSRRHKYVFDNSYSFFRSQLKIGVMAMLMSNLQHQQKNSSS